MRVVLSDRAIEALKDAPPAVTRAFYKQLRFLADNSFTSRADVLNTKLQCGRLDKLIASSFSVFQRGDASIKIQKPIFYFVL